VIVSCAISTGRERINNPTCRMGLHDVQLALCGFNLALVYMAGVVHYPLMRTTREVWRTNLVHMLWFCGPLTLSEVVVATILCSQNEDVCAFVLLLVAIVISFFAVALHTRISRQRHGTDEIDPWLRQDIEALNWGRTGVWFARALLLLLRP
jgi:tellurite resistance protein TehA-like permease